MAQGYGRVVVHFFGGFMMGVCHAVQFRRCILLANFVDIGIVNLSCVLAVISSPAAFEDVRTDFGFLPFQVSGLMQLMSSSLLCALFTFKEFVRLWRSPGHAPPGCRAW
jgi:hypothetical protein